MFHTKCSGVLVCGASKRTLGQLQILVYFGALAFGCVDIFENFGIGEEGACWHEAGDEEPEGCFGGPFVVHLTKKCEAHVGDPEKAVNHADGAYECIPAPDVFERHGDEEEEDGGDGFPGAYGAEAVEGVVELEHVSWKL